MTDTITERPAHLAGHPVSAGTYQRHGCRCTDCTAQASAAVKRSKKKPGSRSALHGKARARARDKAVAWLRDQHPEIWRYLLDEAQREVGLQTRPPTTASTEEGTSA